ncbi:YqhR family membrane protein [Paenibacillus silviterrae]|uniref:YqhR family membrane protein n=1 Tax=Paenibacillus silviterrae TaxID=3242194 RepID=UPI002543C61F|nr:YqhR family membrane protein [Paenibacillus chinjuensis]
MKVQDQTVQHTNPWYFAIYVGFFAGIFWGGLKMLENYLHFTSLSPGFLVEPFFKHSFLMSTGGYVLGWLFFILFSVAAALVYALFFRKVKGPWIGMAYGLAWWGLIYLLVGPVTGMNQPIGIIEINTLITDACLFLVWGLFIGYTITVEFTDERVREPFKKNTHKPKLG